MSNVLPPSGSVLQVESLEATLKLVTFDMHNLKVWSMFPKPYDQLIKLLFLLQVTKQV